MPPEQDDLNRQLEAVQRYVSDLQQREHAKAAAAQPPPAPEPKPKPRRPSRRWLLLTGGPGADRFSGGAGKDVATDFTATQGDTSDGTIP